MVMVLRVRVCGSWCGTLQHSDRSPGSSTRARLSVFCNSPLTLFAHTQLLNGVPLAAQICDCVFASNVDVCSLHSGFST